MTAAESSKKSFVAVINPPDLIFVSWARARCRIPHLGFLPAGDDSANPPPLTQTCPMTLDVTQGYPCSCRKFIISKIGELITRLN